MEMLLNAYIYPLIILTLLPVSLPLAYYYNHQPRPPPPRLLLLLLLLGAVLDHLNIHICMRRPPVQLWLILKGVMLCGWEGNRRFGFAPATWNRLNGLSVTSYRLSGQDWDMSTLPMQSWAVRSASWHGISMFCGAWI